MNQPSPRVKRTRPSWRLWGASIIVCLGIVAGGLYWSGSLPFSQTSAPEAADSDAHRNEQTGDIARTEPEAKVDTPPDGTVDSTSTNVGGSRSADGSSDSDPAATDDGVTASGSEADKASAIGESGEDNMSSSPDQVSKEPGGAATNLEDADPDSVPSEQEQQATISAHYKKLSALKSRCKSSVSSLLGQAKQSIKQAQQDGDEAAAGQAKKQLLASVIDAEGSCKSDFDQIVADASGDFAKQGISTDVIKGWKQEYNETRQESYNKAMEQLQSMIN